MRWPRPCPAICMLIVLFIVSCSSGPAIKSVSNYKETIKEVGKIKVTTEADQVRKDNIAQRLSECEQMQSQLNECAKSNEEKDKKIAELSKDAGKGELTTTLIWFGVAVMGFVLIMTIGLPILKKFIIP